jgi:hypothetical protein
VRGYKRLQERGDFSPLSVFIFMGLLKSLKNDKVINLLENMMYNFDKIVLLY